MQLDITSTSARTSNEEIERAARFYAAQLFRPSTINKLYLEIELKCIEKDFYGYCEWVDDNYRPKEFLITLNKRLSRPNLLRNLAHEIVHMHQYVSGQMFDYVYGPDRKYNNQRYNTETVDYWDQPWEIAAYELEDKLYQDFLKDLNDQNTKYSIS